MQFFRLLLLLLASAAAARASLGDSPAQVQTRYGAPIGSFRDDDGKVREVYRDGGYLILVYSISGFSQAEVYVKESGDELEKEDLLLILKENSLGQQWRPIKTLEDTQGNGAAVWKTAEGGVTAIYGPALVVDRKYPHAMTVATAAYVEELLKSKLPPGALKPGAVPPPAAGK